MSEGKLLSSLQRAASMPASVARGLCVFTATSTKTMATLGASTATTNFKLQNLLIFQIKARKNIPMFKL